MSLTVGLHKRKKKSTIRVSHPRPHVSAPPAEPSTARAYGGSAVLELICMYACMSHIHGYMDTWIHTYLLKNVNVHVVQYE